MARVRGVETLAVSFDADDAWRVLGETLEPGVLHVDVRAGDA